MIAVVTGGIIRRAGRSGVMGSFWQAWRCECGTRRVVLRRVDAPLMVVR